MTGSATTAQVPFRASRALGWLSGFALFGGGLSALYATTGFGLGCAFRALTGWECPLCGGTRLGSALLHGDVAGAFAFNPLLFIGLAVLTVLGGLWIVEVAGGPRVRLPSRWTARIRPLTPNRWLLIAAFVALAYTLFRNLF